MQKITNLLPGLAMVTILAVIAYFANHFLPVLSTLLVAILLGILLRNVGLIPARAEAGIAFASRTVLRAGVVLLGFELSIPVIASLGWGVIATILLTVSCTFLITLLLGRLMRLSLTDTILTATGTSICGAAAVAAMTAVTSQYDEDDADAAATAVAGVTIYGTLAMFLLPILVPILGLNDLSAGTWIGAGVHEVGQVVAAGGLINTAVLDTAVVTKLGRVLMLAPLVVIVGIALARQERKEGSSLVRTQNEKSANPPIVPLFVAGFVAMVALRSVLGLPADHVLPELITQIATLLLTAAMGAMGAGVHLRKVLTTGRKPMLLAAAAGITAASVSLVGTMLFL